MTRKYFHMHSHLHFYSMRQISLANAEIEFGF